MLSNPRRENLYWRSERNLGANNDYRRQYLQTIQTDFSMPVNILSGFACSNCGGWSCEVKTGCEYYWVSFGVVLVEKITNDVRENSKCILIQVTEHKEEKGE